MTTQELEGLVAKFRKLPPSDDMSLEQVRDGMRFFETALPAPDDARVDVIETNGVAAEWVRAPNVADDANNPGKANSVGFPIVKTFSTYKDCFAISFRFGDILFILPPKPVLLGIRASTSINIIFFLFILLKRYVRVRNYDLKTACSI